MTPTSQKMRVVLCGQKHFGAAVFDLLQERSDVDLLGVFSPAYSGRGGVDQLKRKADLFDIPWQMAGTMRADSLPDETDLIIAAHSHDYIGRRTRNRLRIGAIGYHPSLLPRHRGRSSVEWAIKMGDPITGGTVFWLNDTVDGGPIANQDWCWIRPDDDPWRLWTRELSPMGLRLISKTLDDIRSGLTVGGRQDIALATWEPSIDAPPLYRPELLELT